MNEGRRRKFLIVSGGLLAAPFATFAQKEGAVWRIGFLTPYETSYGPQLRPLAGALLRHRYEEGKNLAFEYRSAEGRLERLPALAEELVRLKVDVIVSMINHATAAAMGATTTIPIVMIFVLNPVETGFVKSLARPGGNVTGTTWVSLETSRKHIQIIKEALPSAKRIAILWSPTSPGAQLYKLEHERAATALGITLHYFEAIRPEGVSAALERIAASRPDALFVVQDPIVAVRNAEIVAFAMQRKLVTFGDTPLFVTAGGLFSYAPDLPDLFNLIADQIDHILKGARPSELPVQQPRKFELTINAKAARTIGYKIPQSLLLSANQVIE